MRWTYLANGRTLILDRALCTGCGACLEVCPHNVLAYEAQPQGNHALVEIQDREACMECGACAKNCPFGAIQVEAGVGCAVAILRGLKNGTPPDCDCGGGDACF